MQQYSTNLCKNEVHLAGVLARDPDVRNTPSGKTVANLTVGTTYQGATEYHRCVAWEHQAEKAAGLIKGTFITIVGRLRTRSWLDPKINQKRYTTEIIVWQLVVPGKDPVTQNIHGVTVSDADIPF
jgi:single stranded DNA-binding protein